MTQWLTYGECGEKIQEINHQFSIISLFIRTKFKECKDVLYPEIISQIQICLNVQHIIPHHLTQKVKH